MTYPKFDRGRHTSVFTTRSGNHREAAESFRALRHIGFRKVEILPGREWISDGPSIFHELAYCVAGLIWLQIWRDRERVESFAVEKGDIVFIPAGTSFSLCSGNNDTSVLISATARDGFNIDALPEKVSAQCLIDANGDAAEQRCRNLGPLSEADLSLKEVMPEDGHVVLFLDRNPAQVGRHHTIDSVFDRQVIAREFGVGEINLPDLSLSFYVPTVIRARLKNG